MKTIEKLKSEGFQGVDADLDTSLIEYGLAWKIDVDDNDITFIYDVDGDGTRFNHSHIDADVDVMKKWGWVKWEKDIFPQYEGGKEEFLANPIAWQIHELFLSYGWEEIFGTCYWEGFVIRTSAYEESIRELIEEFSESLIDAIAEADLTPKMIKEKGGLGGLINISID